MRRWHTELQWSVENSTWPSCEEWSKRIKVWDNFTEGLTYGVSASQTTRACSPQRYSIGANDSSESKTRKDHEITVAWPQIVEQLSS